MTTRTYTPEAFEGALSAIVPTRVMPRIREVYFDVASQLYEAIAVETPVDTGYLRAGLSTTAGDESPGQLPPRDRNASYDPSDADAAAAPAIMRAAAELAPLTIGFTAEYAPYVEDTHHMVKGARGQFAAIVDRAVQNQSQEP